MRWLWTVLLIAASALQAWDSGVLGADAFVQAVVAVAILIAPLAWGARARYEVQVGAVALAFVLLTVARMVSPVTLPELHLAAFIPAVLILVLRGGELRLRSVQS
jgi:hypothetical protein